MILVTIDLHSAVTGKVSNLGTIKIDNIGGNKLRGDYRVRAYRKGVDVVATKGQVGLLREGRVLGHQRLAKPISVLVHKALTELGYST